MQIELDMLDETISPKEEGELAHWN